MKFFYKIKKFISKIFIDYNKVNSICEEKYLLLDEKISSFATDINADSNIIRKEISELKEQQNLILQNQKNNLDTTISYIQEIKKDVSYNNVEFLNIKINNKYKNILIIGFYGAPNLGDELMLETLLEYLDGIKNKKITVVLADNPEYSIDKYKDIRFIHYPKTLYDFNVLAEQYDYIIFGGGAIIDDSQYEKENSYQYDLGTILIKLSIRAIAFNKKVICIALSASNEIKNQEYIEKLKYIIQNSCFFSVRDIYTQEYLIKKLGEECKKSINRISDIVLANKAFLNNIRKKSYNDILNIGIIGVSNDNNLEKINTIVENVKKYDMNSNINLIPFYEYKNADTFFYKKLKENSNIKLNIEKYPENMMKTIDLYNKNDIIIGMRYHSILIAYVLNIPCIPICYDIHEHYPYKIKFLNKIFNKKDVISYINMREDDIFNMVKAKVEELEKNNNREVSKKILDKASNEMSKVIANIFKS